MTHRVHIYTNLEHLYIYIYIYFTENKKSNLNHILQHGKWSTNVPCTKHIFFSMFHTFTKHDINALSMIFALLGSHFTTYICYYALIFTFHQQVINDRACNNIVHMFIEIC
jgi:hypothetical protein